ncbi:hypothetical protein HYU22_04570 [Candidatus Woesearchaeota archaeon]|nr:hypothetical protein [Candidatus Woesearchaeota archaeon]
MPNAVVLHATAALGRVGDFFSFIANKLAHFNTLSRGEQVSYSTVGMGIVLVLLALVLFLV